MPAAPLSYTTAVGDGTLDVFSLSFPYIDETHVHFYIGTTEVQIVEFVTQSTVRVATAPPAGSAITIRRCTPICERLVDYFDGSTLGEADLDTSILQVFYRMQEQEDDLDLTGIANYGTYEIAAFAINGINPNEYFLIHDVITTYTLRASVDISRAYAVTAPAVISFSQTIEVIPEIGGPNQSVGTVDWVAGTNEGTVNITDDYTLLPGDILLITNPASLDGAMSGVTISLGGDR